MNERSKTILVFFIFLYWCTYENLIFLHPSYYGGFIFEILVFSFKLLFPFYFLLRSLQIKNNKFSAYYEYFYFFFFFLFLSWSLIPTIIGGDIVSWIKLIPIFAFSLACYLFWPCNEIYFLRLAKILVSVSLFSLVQYLLVNITGIYASSRPDSLDLTGPFGLFGATQSRFQLPGLERPIIRLCGFWKEPSNAAGFNFASFYISKYIYAKTNSIKWKYISTLCLIAGFLTLSNAGYLTIAVCIFIGFVFSFRSLKNYQKILGISIISPIFLLLLWFALFGRTYYSEHKTENTLILSLVGIRGNEINSEDYDPTAGRADLLDETINSVKKNIIGIGIQKTGDDFKVKIPAGAPFFWLALTGIFGLTFILLRELSTFLSIKTAFILAKENIYIIQAYFAILIQQSIYGVWMDPSYVIFSTFLITCLNRYKRNVLCVE
jgi:hypothetical protein